MSILISKKILTSSVLGMSLIALSACSLKDGNRPESMSVNLIAPFGGDAQAKTNASGVLTAEIAPCTQFQIQPIVTYTDGTSGDFGARASYTSSNAAVASVNTNGLIQGVSAGTATITTRYLDLVSTIEVTVPSVSYAISPANITLARNTNLQPQLIATAGTGASQRVFDATNQFIWGATTDISASNTTIAAIGGFISAGSSAVNATLTVTPVFTCSATNATAPLKITTATVDSLTVEADSGASAPIVLPQGGVRQRISITGNFSDGTTQDLTTQITTGNFTIHPASCTDTDSSTAVAVVANGIARDVLSTTSVTADTNVTVCATFAPTDYPAPATGSLAFTVKPAVLRSLAIQPAPKFFALNGGTLGGALGTELPLQANAQFSTTSTTDCTATPANCFDFVMKNAPLIWASSNATKIFASNASPTEGYIFPLSASVVGDTANITANATVAGITVSAPAVVFNVKNNPTSLSIQDPNGCATISVGETCTVNVTATYADGATQNLNSVAAWSSSTTATATVDAGFGRYGDVFGVATGSTTITAAFKGLSASLNVTVN